MYASPEVPDGKEHHRVLVLLLLLLLAADAHECNVARLVHVRLGTPGVEHHVSMCAYGMLQALEFQARQRMWALEQDNYRAAVSSKACTCRTALALY